MKTWHKAVFQNIETKRYAHAHLKAAYWRRYTHIHIYGLMWTLTYVWTKGWVTYHKSMSSCQSDNRGLPYPVLEMLIFLALCWNLLVISSKYRRPAGESLKLTSGRGERWWVWPAGTLELSQTEFERLTHVTCPSHNLLLLRGRVHFFPYFSS